MSAHLGLPIASPAIMEKIGTRFRRAVAGFAKANGVALVMFKKGDRKRDVMDPYLRRQARHGIVRGRWDRGGAGVPERVRRHRADRSRPMLVQLLQGRPAGHLLLLLSVGRPSSGPRSSRSAPTSRIRSRSGSTGTNGRSSRPARPGSGSPSCPTGSPPATTRPGCRRSATGSARATSTRSSTVDERSLPVPLTDADRAAGYWWELSMRQIETSRTIVFDAPRHARGFFEALVVDNLDLGRPDRTELVFTGHRVRRGRPPQAEPSTTPGSTPATPSASP